MKQVETEILDIEDPNKSYTIDDTVTIQSNITSSKLVTINNNGNTKSYNVKGIVKNNKPVTKTKITQTTTTSKVENKKSSNAYLSNITIENYNIDFDKGLDKLLI